MMFAHTRTSIRISCKQVQMSAVFVAVAATATATAVVVIVTIAVVAVAVAATFDVVEVDDRFPIFTRWDFN